MSKQPTEASNTLEISVETTEFITYWQNIRGKSWALMAIEADEEEEREREEEERARVEEARTRFQAQMEERRRLYALGLYELEEGEILE